MEAQEDSDHYNGFEYRDEKKERFLTLIGQMLTLGLAIS
jgi:hypothetical protein